VCEGRMMHTQIPPAKQPENFPSKYNNFKISIKISKSNSHTINPKRKYIQTHEDKNIQIKRSGKENIKIAYLIKWLDSLASQWSRHLSQQKSRQDGEPKKK